MASSAAASITTGFASASTGWSGTRVWAQRLLQTAVLLPVLALVVIPEYAQTLVDAEAKSILYRATLGPLRLVDALLLVVIAVHVAAWAGSRRMHVHFPRSLMAPGIGFVAAITLAMVYGTLYGGSNLFFDWRALALGMGCYVVLSLWLQTREQVEWAVVVLAAMMAVRMGSLYAGYLGGGGDVIVGMRVLVYDGPTLSAMVFVGLLAVFTAGTERGWRAAGWWALGGASYLLVVLCFRRTFWAELGIGTALMLGLHWKRWKTRFALAVVVAACAAAMAGPAFYERLASMDFTQDQSEYSQGNSDHVGEVLDAWDEARRSPVFGIGLGRAFETQRIAGWKDESVMVHNAPLHVWLKYGALGLICYVWFHVAMLGWLWRTNRKAMGGQWEGQAARCAVVSVLPSAVLAWLTAKFVVSLGFAPWPYSSLQLSILIAFLLALMVQGENVWNCQAFPSLRRR